MKKIIISLLAIFFLMACETEYPQDTLIDQELNSNASRANLKADKRNICHKGENIISVSINALASHQAHGDAVDMDQDGFFDLANECGMPIDCDDTDATLTADCSISCIEDELEVLIDPDGISENGDEYKLYVFPVDLGQVLPDGTIREIWGPEDEDIVGLPNLNFEEARIDFNGLENTAAIVAQLGDYNDGNYAAKICADLITEDCDDWYLPAAGELLAIIDQLGLDWAGEINNADVEFIFHWTSSENSDVTNYMVRTGSGALFSNSFGKDFPEHCRCVRKEEL